MEKDFASSQQAFETALQIDHNFAESHGGLAVLAAMQKQKSEAQEHIKRALSLDSQCMSVHYAQVLLNEEMSSPEAIRRFAGKLLKARFKN